MRAVIMGGIGLLAFSTAAAAQSGLWMTAIAVSGPRYGCEVRMTLNNNLTEAVSHIFINLRYHWGGDSKTDNVLFSDIRSRGKQEKVSILMMEGCPPDLRMSFVGVGTCSGPEMVRFNNCDEHLDGMLFPGQSRITPPPK